MDFKNKIDTKVPLKHSSESEYRGNPYLYTEVKNEICTFNQPFGSILVTENVTIHRKNAPVILVEHINALNESNIFSVNIKFNDNFIIFDDFILKSIGDDIVRFSDEFNPSDCLNTELCFSLEDANLLFRDDLQRSFAVFNQDLFGVSDTLVFKNKESLTLKDNLDFIDTKDLMDFEVENPNEESVLISDGFRVEFTMENFEEITRDEIMIVRDKFNGKLTKSHIGSKKTKGETRFSTSDNFSFKVEPVEHKKVQETLVEPAEHEIASETAILTGKSDHTTNSSDTEVREITPKIAIQAGNFDHTRNEDTPMIVSNAENAQPVLNNLDGTPVINSPVIVSDDENAQHTSEIDINPKN